MKMPSPLENLATQTLHLTAEPRDEKEFLGLIRSGQTRLLDAQNTALSLESRFDLAYNAAHAFCLAALRWQGFRAKNRYIVFQVLPHTLGLGPEVWRILAKCHDMRNLSEYEGDIDVDARIVAELIIAVNKVQAALRQLTTHNESK
jgi:hypothetical protein